MWNNKQQNTSLTSAVAQTYTGLGNQLRVTAGGTRTYTTAPVAANQLSSRHRTRRLAVNGAAGLR